MVQMIRPSSMNTFKDYMDVVKLYVLEKANLFDYIHIVFDVYIENSLKASTRESRGNGIKLKVTPNGPLPSNWHNFLCNNENKSALFKLIADCICQIYSYSAEIVVTEENTVLSNTPADLSTLSPCFHEEADTRMLLHASRCIGSLIIKTVDTDVVVIAIACFHDLDVDYLWIELGTKPVTYFPIHEIAQSLEANLCQGLLFFHALTGCDTTSSFYNVEKKKWWNTWMEHKSIFGPVFSRLSAADELSDRDLSLIEHLVCLQYTKEPSIKSVDECRLSLHQKGIAFERLPPSQRALHFHVKRAMLQSNVWRKSLFPRESPQDPSKWGWILNEFEQYIPHWTDLPPTTSLADHFVKCGCKTKCSKSKRCSCKTKERLCTSLCTCTMSYAMPPFFQNRTI